MLALNEFWRRVTKLGVSEGLEISDTQKKRMVFYNKAMFIGFFATIFQIICIWPFIGSSSLILCTVLLVLTSSFFSTSIGYFEFAKRVTIFYLYLSSSVMACYLGASGYFHINVITIFTFSLIVFDFRKERIEIFLGLCFTIFILLIGELALFNAPDFSGHPFVIYTKIANLLSFTVMNVVFIVFIIQLNLKNEDKLKASLMEKQKLLIKLTQKTHEIEEDNRHLEDKIKNRTSRVLSQKNVLEIQNKEKEVLLKEVHHRVKNNLQIIVSLINIQRSRVDDNEVEEALAETQNRVLSMSLVHQKMYQTSNFQEIGLSDYVDELIDNINRLYLHKLFTNETSISNELKIDVETAIPLGLIVNEIITNFFKYAFSEKTNSPHFIISVFKESANICKFHFSDNGPGFPEKINIENVDTLGLKLIQGLVRQIDGEVKFSNKEGAQYIFTFHKKVK